MRDDTAADSGGSTDRSEGGLRFTRREALALLGAGTVAGVANTATATSSTADTTSPVEWQKERDAQGHDLLNAATVGTTTVDTEAFDVDVLEGVDSVTDDDAALDHVKTGAASRAGSSGSDLDEGPQTIGVLSAVHRFLLGPVLTTSL